MSRILSKNHPKNRYPARCTLVAPHKIALLAWHYDPRLEIFMQHHKSLSTENQLGPRQSAGERFLEPSTEPVPKSSPDQAPVLSLGLFPGYPGKVTGAIGRETERAAAHAVELAAAQAAARVAPREAMQAAALAAAGVPACAAARAAVCACEGACVNAIECVVRCTCASPRARACDCTCQ